MIVLSMTAESRFLKRCLNMRKCWKTWNLKATRLKSRGWSFKLIWWIGEALGASLFIGFQTEIRQRWRGRYCEIETMSKDILYYITQFISGFRGDVLEGAIPICFWLYTQRGLGPQCPFVGHTRDQICHGCLTPLINLSFPVLITFLL